MMHPSSAGAWPPSIDRPCCWSFDPDTFRPRPADAPARLPLVVRPTAAVPDSPLDAQVRAPTTGRRFTLRALFSALRAKGVRPHSEQEDADERVAGRILGTLARPAVHPFAEGNVPPLSILTVAEGTYPRMSAATLPGTPPNFQASAQESVGTYANMVADLAAMGVGRLRRVGQCDIYWACVFPNDETSGDLFQFGTAVRAPLDMLTEMRADGYRRLSATTEMILACLVRGVKLDLTPFNSGGGSQMNYTAGDETSDRVLLDATNHEVPSQPTWAEVLTGRPAWQESMLVNSGYGWDSYYRDVDKDSRLYPSYLYQKFVTNVWPTIPDLSQTEARSPYNLECARRKALGTAAFAWGIGEWLATLHTALGTVGGIHDVVEVIELGNELDGFWTHAATGDDPQAINADLQRQIDDGAMEAGAYLALIAGPIWMQLPAMKFKMEMRTWATHGEPLYIDDYPSKLAWVDKVIRTGMTAELRRWFLLRVARSAPAFGAMVEADAWFAAETLGGFSWPPVDTSFTLPSVTNLIHQVGVHWFHDYNKDTNNADYSYDYADTNRLISDYTALRTTLNHHAHHPRLSLEVTAGAITFPAVDPGPRPTPAYGASPPWSKRYQGTDDILQAAMHVRYLSSLVACGAASSGIFTFSTTRVQSQSPYPQVRVATWKPFWGDGIHSDMLYSAGLNASQGYLQGQDCWPRPVWFACRRLVWLFSHLGATPSAQMNILVAAEGLTLIELRLVREISHRPDGSPAVWRWTRAYLAWLDQYSLVNHGRSGALLSFTDGASDAPAPGYELCSLVPSVEPYRFVDGSGVPADVNGYARPAALDWAWRGWDDACIPRGHQRAHAAFTTGPNGLPSLIQVGASFDIEVVRTQPIVNSARAPVCILTTSSFSGMV